METIQRWVDGKIDFQGQRLADRIMQEGLVAGAAIAFLLGWWTQNMQLCMLTFGASTLLVALITVPAWPIYTKHAVEWLPNTSTSSDGSENDPATAASAGDKTSKKETGTGKTNSLSAAS